MLLDLEDLPCHQELLVALYLLLLPGPFIPLPHHRHSQGCVLHNFPYHHPLQVVPPHPLAPHPWME